MAQFQDPLPSADPAPDGALPVRHLLRAERRLRAIQKVVNHDLPNQLLAVQGLLQLLAIEEGAQLLPEGQELMHRLQGAARRGQHMIQALKNLGRVALALEKPETFPVQEAMEEAASQVRQLVPGVLIETGTSTHRALADRLALAQALEHLLYLAASVAAPAGGKLEIGAEQTSQGLTIWISVGPIDPAHTGTRLPLAPPRGWEERFEVVLARELAETCGGEVRLPRTPEEGRLFVVSIPGVGDN